MPSVHFFTEDIGYDLKNKNKLKTWIKETVSAEGCKLGVLNYIFCSDEYLLRVNRQYLDHDTYTDIITFDHSESRGKIAGDIFISIERVRENALKFAASETDELHRVMIHGALHLIGYDDKKAEQKLEMTGREDYYLEKRDFS